MNPRLLELDRRRRLLGMSYVALAERSGVSAPTLKRVLGRSSQGTSIHTVEAIARALGMTVELRAVEPEKFSELEADKKARRIASMVQATSALENQAVDPAALDRMVQRSRLELLAGSRRRLWAS